MRGMQTNADRPLYFEEFLRSVFLFFFEREKTRNFDQNIFDSLLKFNEDPANVLSKHVETRQNTLCVGDMDRSKKWQCVMCVDGVGWGDVVRADGRRWM
jgi:hypothetical protein